MKSCMYRYASSRPDMLATARSGILVSACLRVCSTHPHTPSRHLVALPMLAEWSRVTRCPRSWLHLPSSSPGHCHRTSRTSRTSGHAATSLVFPVRKEARGRLRRAVGSACSVEPMPATSRRSSRRQDREVSPNSTSVHVRCIGASCG
jgi:hypothetical protein